ncbi:MAG: N-acetylmuramoyl-L-alanine amidase [Pseudomonadota bacterium]
MDQRSDDEPGAVERPSPNHGPRRGVSAPDLVIVHYTGMPSAEAALARLCDPVAEVSAHWLIAETGALFRLVPETARAWHAGVSFWGRGAAAALEADVNSRSIGIELAHPGHVEARAAASGLVCPPFPEAQMAALEGLLERAMARWRLAPEAVLAHSDVAPGRKIDPGERFDWTRLARRGLAAPRPEGCGGGRDGGERDGDGEGGERGGGRRGGWARGGGGDDDRGAPPAAPSAALDEAVAAAMRRAGYGDWPAPALLDALRRRWRPERAAAAPADHADLRLAEALAAR